MTTAQMPQEQGTNLNCKDTQEGMAQKPKILPTLKEGKLRYAKLHLAGKLKRKRKKPINYAQCQNTISIHQLECFF